MLNNEEKELILNKAKALLQKIQNQKRQLEVTSGQSQEQNKDLTKPDVVEQPQQQPLQQPTTVANVKQTNTVATTAQKVKTNRKLSKKEILNLQFNELEAYIAERIKYHDTSFVSNINSTQQPKDKLDDIAIIQCFYGTNLNRIEAAIRAVKNNIFSDPGPKDYIFVEAQKNKSDAVFSFLKKYKINYKFIKIPPQSDGLFLKTALWNIGATMTDASKLCFVDADVAFCNKNWLAEANEAFNQYDVLSLSKLVYYENNPERDRLIQTIGYRLMSGTYNNNAHIGFNIGMTRHAYEDVYGRFEAFNMHDDSWIWSKILGTDIKKELVGWIPYKPTDEIKYGLPLKVGSCESICCHLDHSYENELKYVGYGYLSYVATEYPFQDITYDKSDPYTLPIWNDTLEAKTIKACFKELDEIQLDKKIDTAQLEQIYVRNATKIYGSIDDENPLIIITMYYEDFKHKDPSIIQKHFDMLSQYSDVPFTYVCFSNVEVDGIDTIPYKVKKGKLKEDYIEEFLTRKDVSWPKNANIAYIDIDTNVSKLFALFRSNDTKPIRSNKYLLKNLIYVTKCKNK